MTCNCSGLSTGVFGANNKNGWQRHLFKLHVFMLNEQYYKKKREQKKTCEFIRSTSRRLWCCVVPRKNSMPNTEFVWWPPKLTNSPRVELWLNSICLLCSSDIYFFYCCWRMHKHKSLWCRLLQASCMWAYLPIRTSARTLSHRSSLIGWKFNSLLCSRWLMSGG